MADGGFLIRFDGKEADRCCEVTFGYDAWEYTTNAGETKPIPEGVRRIIVEIED